MKKWRKAIISCILVALGLSGCQAGESKAEAEQPKPARVHYHDFTFQVNPKNFAIYLKHGGVRELASKPIADQRVANFHQNKKEASWSYPDQHVHVKLEKKKNYLNVSLHSTGAEKFRMADPFQKKLYSPIMGRKTNSGWRQQLEEVFRR
ncbi:hypothetical protein WD019_15695 [Fictibacillus sp. Mic-4]